MGASRKKVLQVVTGWEAVELVLKCAFIGLWQFVQISIKQLWKGHRRKVAEKAPIELTIDSSVGTHCSIKIMGVKYHYVETGPKSGQIVLILGDAPETDNLWGPNWTRVVQKLAEAGYNVLTLDLRGTGGSEGGNRRDLSPPRAVEELTTLLEALGVSEKKPAVVIGFGVGGLLAWYLAHSHGPMVGKLAVVGAPHPNLYWQFPSADFCCGVQYFLQWPHFPEQWLAEDEVQASAGRRASRARDWSGALNYVRGAAWWRVRAEHRVTCATLLVGARDSAAQLVTSAQHCLSVTLRMVTHPGPADRELAHIVLDFLIDKDKTIEEPRTLMGRVFGAVAGRGRELTAKLTLPPAQG